MTEPAGQLRRMTRLKSIVDVVVTVALLFAAVLVIWRHWPSAPRPRINLPMEPVTLDGIALRGSPGAPIVILGYSDFECPFCGRFTRETLPVIDETYVRPGRVQFGFRHLILPQHARAERAAHAVECAGSQGRFFEMHDALFRDQTKIGEADLFVHAQALGLNLYRFTDCLKDAAPANQIRRDAEAARAMRISSTPTFLIGVKQPDGRVKFVKAIEGAVPAREFADALEPTLAGINEGSRRGQTTALGAVVVIVIGSLAWAARHRRRQRRAYQA